MHTKRRLVDLCRSRDCHSGGGKEDEYGKEREIWSRRWMGDVRTGVEKKRGTGDQSVWKMWEDRYKPSNCMKSY